MAVPVPVLPIVELHYLDFCSHPDLKASEKHFSSIFCVFSPPEALQLSLSLFPPCFSSLSLISWLNKPLVSCLLSSSSFFFFHLPFPPFPPSFISYSLSLSASLPPFLSPPYLSFHSVLTVRPMLEDLLCNYGVNMTESHSVQLLSLPGLDLHCDSEVN